VRRIVGSQGEQGPRAWSILRLGIGAFLSMDVMMISLLLYGGSIEPQAVAMFRLILLGLSAPAAAILLYPFVIGSIAEIRRRRLSLDTLIAIGAVAALGVSAVNAIRGRGQIYFDTAVMLLLLVTVGRMIEAFAKSRAVALTRALESLLPAQATRLVDGQPRTVALGELAVGDRVLVRPGERFPVDGVIVEGVTLVEQAQFTGEPAPQTRSEGQEVIAGTINAQNPVVVQARQVGGDLLLRRIVRGVEQARQNQAPLERLAGKLASAFIPVVLALAGGTAIYWLLAAGPAQALLASLAVLVVACPCAMGIAAPLTNLLAIARAAEQGIVVRGADVMENVGRAGTIFFDKTGTLTLGQMRVTDVQMMNSHTSADELLSRLAALESHSEHALARAVVEEAHARGLTVPSARDVRNFPGMGLRGLVGPENLEVVAGSDGFVGRAEDRGQTPISQTKSISVPDLPVPDLPQAAGQTVIQVAWLGRVQGQIVLADTPRDGASTSMARLRGLGVRTVLLSGDSADAAGAMARDLGIDRVHAPCLPDEKLRLVTEADGHLIVMVGDGVNDAPALAAAPVGIAMGAGTDLARQAGNIVLLRSRLDQIPDLIVLGRRARRIILQNLLWALGYNGVALGFAAAGYLHPLLAALAMAGSSLTILANSSRVRRTAKLEIAPQTA
jgi:heavy metal translocating P-type ATPase